MKKSKKNLKINIKPFDSSIRRYEGGFTWTFTSTMGDGVRRKIVNVKFNRWWLVYLAAELRTVIKEEQDELNRIIELTEFKIWSKKPKAPSAFYKQKSRWIKKKHTSAPVNHGA